MSAKDETFVTTEMSKMINAPETYPIFASTDDNAALAYLGSAPNNHPINENRKTRDDHRVSKSLIDIMYKEVTAPEIDYRVFVYANVAEASGALEGLPNGMKSSSAAAYLGNGLKNTSTIGDYFTEATFEGMLMSYPELQFILAEAAHKGYVPGGDAKAAEYYVEGISSSYLYYATEIGEGIGNYYGVPGDAYVPGSGGGSDPLLWFLDDGGWVYNPAIAMEQIATQKWVAMFDQGLQSWIEWRRLDLPVLTPAIDGVLSGEMPIRIYYPSDEYSRNKTNVEAAVASQGKDDLLTPVWWDVD